MHKGIILAGGAGTRLAPATTAVSKQLLPIYNKPMIYYPLTTLMESGIRDILVISQSHNLPLFRTLFGDGTQWGIKIEYAVQDVPAGIAQALTIAWDAGWLAEKDTAALILGDNIFHGIDSKLISLAHLRADEGVASIFLTKVQDPERYGVAVFKEGRVAELIEKPASFISNWAVTGLYVYPAKTAVEAVRHMKPSGRGELEITDLNRVFLLWSQLEAVQLGRGVAWLDTGTPQSMLQASQYVQTIEDRQGRLVGSPEAAAWEWQWICKTRLLSLANNCPGEYGSKLLQLYDD